MGRLILSGISAAALLGVGLLSASPAHAQRGEAARDIPPVSYDVLVAYAQEKQGSTDAGCQALSKRLPMRYGTLTTHLQRKIDVIFGDQAQIELPTGDLRLVPVQVHNGRLHTHFQMEGRMNLRMQMTNGKAAIFGPMRHQDGFLIVQITPDFSVYIRDGASRSGGPKLYPVRDQVQPPAKR